MSAKTSAQVRNVPILHVYKQVFTKISQTKRCTSFQFLNFSVCAYIAILEKLDSKPMLKTLKQPEFRWPVVGDGLGGEYQWSAEQWSLLKTLAEMRNLHSKSALIRLYVSPDDKNSSHYIIKVRHPRFTVITVNTGMFVTFGQSQATRSPCF